MYRITSVCLVVVFLVSLFAGCAGMSYETQNNMAINGATWGVIGAAVGTGIAAISHSSLGAGAILGGLIGAGAGVVNTPGNPAFVDRYAVPGYYYGPPAPGYYYGPYVSPYPYYYGPPAPGYYYSPRVYGYYYYGPRGVIIFRSH